MRAGTAMRRFPRAASRLTGTGGRSPLEDGLLRVGSQPHNHPGEVADLSCDEVCSLSLCHLLLGPYWFDVALNPARRTKLM